MTRCLRCDRVLTPDECAVYRRLVNRGAARYMCKTCLAAYYKVSEAVIDEKIEQYRAMGCNLFGDADKI